MQRESDQQTGNHPKGTLIVVDSAEEKASSSPPPHPAPSLPAPLEPARPQTVAPGDEAAQRTRTRRSRTDGSDRAGDIDRDTDRGGDGDAPNAHCGSSATEPEKSRCDRTVGSVDPAPAASADQDRPAGASVPAGHSERAHTAGRDGRARLAAPSMLPGKRISDDVSVFTEGPPPSKRRRPDDDLSISKSGAPGPRPDHMELPGRGDAGSKGDQPISPLFFSNSKHAASRIPTFSSADPATAMHSHMRDHPDGVTTLKLARGRVAASPARSGSTPGGSSSDFGAAASKSPDSRGLPPGLDMMQGIAVVELLEQDDRPSFVVDLTTASSSARQDIAAFYINPALRACATIVELLFPSDADALSSPEYTDFRSWVTCCARGKDGADVSLPPSHSYGTITWTCSTLRRRFRVVSASGAVGSFTPSPPEGRPAGRSEPLASTEDTVTPDARALNPPDYFGSMEYDKSAADEAAPLTDAAMVDADNERYHSDEFTRTVLQSQFSSFDWTRIPLTTPNLSSHIHFARSVDWGSTPLGPIEDWSADLRAMSNLIMASPHPAAMYWGRQYIAIYNEAYIDLAGKKHPQLMGMSYIDAWKEIWSDIEPVFANAWDSGQATMKHEDQLFINRHGFLEETFFSWSIVPLIGFDGQVAGLYNPAFENTKRKVNERWMLTLREVGERTAAAKSVKGFWPQVQMSLEYNDLDVPFALIYSVKEETDSEASSTNSESIAGAPQFVLEGSVGVPEGHPSAVTNLDLRESREGFAPHMRSAMNSGAPVVLSEEAGNLPSELLEGVEWRGFGQPVKTVVVFPVVPTAIGESVIGCIVLGANPRRPYDEDYQLFIQLLARQLATSMASTVLFEEEIKRGQRAARLAALDRQELSLQLRLRTQEAVESEYKFTRMAEFAPVGMFIANSLGQINYCNDMWRQISRHEGSANPLDTWMESVRDEDRAELEVVWRKLLSDKVAVTHEFRYKHTHTKGDQEVDTWALMSAYPEKDEGGNVKLIFGCVTDISSQKLAETVQKQRRDEALELKRQQENFIDITSHEMRNPLSAILQCADEIGSNIAAFRRHGLDEDELRILLDSCTEASNVINLCASHQKRIVDDILTLSKLDSKLLLVTPSDAQPVGIVQSVLKMFESELITHDIQLEFAADGSYDELGIGWVRLDHSRLSQILINLMTNAIKFTRNSDVRRIAITVGASTDHSQYHHPAGDFSFVPPAGGPDNSKLTSGEGWGQGEEVNLHFSVSDTGLGLSEDERTVLFQRFSQATPRTHVQYGGSGLGLFISRILAELQGGQIGCKSEKDRGSTFKFFVKARRSESPPVSSTPVMMPIKLPKSKADKVAARVAVAVPKRPAPQRRPSSSSSSSQRRRSGLDALDVLIVEDNLVNQKVLERQLKNCGNNTHVANHGGEALETLRMSRFWRGREADGIVIHIILMDLEMPVMDGMTCTKEIRRLEREGALVAHVPIMAVTAYARPEQIAEAIAAGMDGVISKPFRLQELLPKIDELVARYGAGTRPTT